jgi:branched-chain amino acid transport system permease protein
VTGLTRIGRVTLPIGLVAGAGLLVPNLVSAFWLRSLLSAVVFALPALGIAILFGRLSIAPLAQVGLVAVGGWCALRLSHGTDLPFPASVAAGGLAAAALGGIIGLPALRIKGLYLAIVTLLTAGAIEKIVATTGFPDGGSGGFGRDTTGGRVAMARPVLATSDAAYFRFVVVITALCFAAVAVVRFGRFGRMWAIIGQGDTAAAAAGINVTAVRTVAFVLAGFLSGVAGGLLAGGIGFLDPNSFGASESLLLFALVLAAGTRSLAGALVAALLYRALPSLLDELGVAGDIATVMFGLALIHAMVSGADGLTGQLAGLARIRRRRSPTLVAEAE